MHDRSMSTGWQPILRYRVIRHASHQTEVRQHRSFTALKGPLIADAIGYLRKNP